MADEPYLMRRYDLSGGMNQSTNPFVMGDNAYTYLKNMVHDEQSSLSKDGGYSTYLDEIAGADKDDLIFDYVDYDGTHEVVKCANANFYKAGAASWTSVDTSVYTEGNKVSAVNFLDRVYFAESGTNIQYYDGSTVENIYSDNGSANVRGKYLTTIGTVMFLGNVTSVYDSNQVVYTYPGTHVFYNSNEEDYDTYATTSQVLSVVGDITGIKGYQGVLLIFTEENVWIWNPEVLGEPKILAETGCVAHDTIKEIDGILYWAGRDGVYRFNGSSMPTIISLPITNWVVNSLWRLIDGDNWSSMSAGVLDGRYLLWVGDLTAALPGDSSALSDVVLVYDTYRDSWSFFDNHPANQWATIVNSDGDKRLIFGSNADGQSYQRDYSYTHDTSAIDGVVRTKYFDMENPESEKVLKDLYVSYRPEAEVGKYLSVAAATNGSNSYTTYLDSSSSTKLPLTGAASLEYQFERVSLGELRGRTVSYEFSNNDSGVGITLLGFTQEFDYKNPNLNYTTG